MTEIIVAISLGICLSAACGLRVFLPFLIASIAAKCGLIELKDSFHWIASWPALIAFATATIAEVTAFYVPWLDNVLDSIATPAAGIAGTIITVSVMPSDSSTLLSWALGIICGGGAATAVQMTTVAARATSTLTTGGLANPIVSTMELAGASIISMLAVFIPVVIVGFVLLIIVLGIFYISQRRIGIFRKQKSASTHSRRMS